MHPHSPDHMALDILREQAQTLPPYAARIAQWYTIKHLRLDDWWRSALLRTLSGVAGTTPVPHGPDLDRVLGTPGAWTNVMERDVNTFDLRTWLRSVQFLADAYAVKVPTPHS